MIKRRILILSIIVVVLVTIAIWFYAEGREERQEEEAPSEYQLDGKVLEIQKDYLMIEALEGQVVSGEVHVWIGLLSDKDIPDIKEGDVIRIPHDGKMTMSLPPQMSANGTIKIIK